VAVGLILSKDEDEALANLPRTSFLPIEAIMLGMSTSPSTSKDAAESEVEMVASQVLI
jgi:hypothetical protein